MVAGIYRGMRPGGPNRLAARALPALPGHLYRRAAAPAGQDAVLILAHLSHGVGQPKASTD